MKAMHHCLTSLTLAILASLLCRPAGVYAQPAPNPHLAPVMWMIGDWEGVERGATNDLVVHIHCALTDNKQALVYDVHFTKSGNRFPKYHGMYYWDPESRMLRLQQVSDEGNVGTGTYTPSDSTAEQFVTVATGTQVFELQSHYVIHPTDFHFTANFRPSKDADWLPAVDVVYKRVR